VRFFTDHERATVEAAAARLFPSDTTPGVREANVVRYIDHLLAAFDQHPPLIFAGGPVSGRQPEPDAETGQPSDHYPKDRFQRFLPLSRAKELAWRVRLYGSANVAGGDFNDAVLGPTKGWRDIYRNGIVALDAKSRETGGKDFAGLSGEQQDQAWAQVVDDFPSLLVEHTLEGLFSAPEYGGNDGLAGWTLVQFEGDSQPLGYSVYDETAGQYREIAGHPVSTANPGEQPGFGPEAADLIESIVRLIGGERFF
jgi:gluconate 2-dehydrogenase gamma chain